ncbi:MAG: DUF86 domain-containing protein [Deltaproteobacteria bacterium]|nr:DUF86 domain-containing protein [Deltaproteobacteria bacterium]MBW2253863.1 DUF86 domain-containing protein [Deltaproteobacteria bacterium]
MTSGRADPAVLRRHLLALDRALTNLEHHTGHSQDDLEQDLDLQWTVLHGLQLCTHCALDIATHIAASGGHDVADYASAIDVLAVMGVLPPPFAKSFRAIAGFQNILVLGYLELDLERVQAVLQHQLEDFRSFAAHVEAFHHEG